MPTVIGIWFGLAGGLSVIVGAVGLRRIRQLRSHGQKAWAAVTPLPSEPGEPKHTLFRYELTDGRVVERTGFMSARKAAALRPGQKLLVWYDPADPEDILVYGRKYGIVEAAFLIAGVVVILGGALLAALGA